MLAFQAERTWPPNDPYVKRAGVKREEGGVQMGGASGGVCVEIGVLEGFWRGFGFDPPHLTLGSILL